MTTKKEAAPAPSSTVLVLRDSPFGLEVLMVQRHHAIDFASGAMVFPGGKLALGDSADGIAGHCRLGDRLPPELLTHGVAAIREAFEESGVLLARRRGEEALVAPERIEQLEPWRQRLDRGEVGMADFAAAESLEFALDQLEPFAHWITPATMPKRFDTWFFLAPAPTDQIARHDGRESVDARWVSPVQLLADGEAGKATIVFATRMNLKKLAESRTARDAVRDARGRTIATVTPQVTLDPALPGGGVLRIPAEAGYGVTEITLDRVGR